MSGLGGMIFWGAQGHAKVLRECLQHCGPELLAVFDNDPGVAPPFPDVPLHVGRDGFERWKAERGGGQGIGFLVAIGGERGRDRLELQKWLSSQGLTPMRVIHQTAFVAGSAVLSEGTQVLAQAAVCVEARLGRACIVNTGATVDHECTLGDGVHIGPGARLAGCVEVADFTLIGAGAIVLPRIRIGGGVVVGAGAVVTRDVEDNAVVIGNPARVKLGRSKGS